MRSSQKFNLRKESVPSLGAKTAHAGAPRGFSTWEFCYDQSFADGDDATRCVPAPSHRHPRFQIFWVRQGQARLRLDLESLEVRGPCLMVVGPGEVPTWEHPWELAGTVATVDAGFISPPNFGLGFDSVARFLETAARRSLALNPAENALTGNFFSQIRQLGDAPHCGGPEVLKALLLVLFGGLSRSPPAPRLDGPSAPPSRMTRDFKSALRSECPRLTTVTEYAGFLKVSRLVLHQSVLRDTGRCPGDLIKDRLLLEAKRLLRHPSESPTEIGRRLGLSEGGHLSALSQSHAPRGWADFRRQASSQGSAGPANS